MEKKYDLCLEILKRFQQVGILDKIIIVGSWCIYFYKEYFQNKNYTSSIRTRDIDILVPLPFRSKKTINIPELLKDLGFIVDFHREGYIRLLHPELIIEFLVPEKGRGTDKPIHLPQLGIKAEALRYMSFIVDNIIKLNVYNLTINLPHPAAFALHGLLVSSRRFREWKKIKEKQEAIHVLNALIENGEEEIIRKLFNSMPKKWKQKVVNILEELEEINILNILILRK
ncbi:MAG: nucleotidyltransferase domain-containing protein [Actinobacteria bacterium]|nr:nucleotidyltransferase domain-containing protein [Actinomycetota bacterium]